MNSVDYCGNSSYDMEKKNNNNNNNNNNKYENVNLFSIKNAFQGMVIQKTMECHELLSSSFHLTHPLAKMSLAFILLNPWKTWIIIKDICPKIYSMFMYSSRSFEALINRKTQPCKKTFEIYSIIENSINHLYVAFDWFLKYNSKIKKKENHKIMSMIKPIVASKENKEYPLLETVPESMETEFTYSGCIFYYSKTSKDDVIYAPSGEIKKRNYKLELWSYYASDEIIKNLSNHVIDMYAKSKIEEIWKQKLYTHDNGVWKHSDLGRNKRKINSVILKNDENDRISTMLADFSTSEEWHLERNIPYKKSFLFYGPPGTGKSSMIKAISFETQRHIHYINLSVIKNDYEFSNLMSKIDLKETVLVLEDIDAQNDIVQKRNKEYDIVNNNKNDDKNDDKHDDKHNDKHDDKHNDKHDDKKQHLTLSTILNHIDGVHNNHAMILIMTTNYPEKLDEALIRSGRVDERILFSYCDIECIYKMFLNFYRDLCPHKTIINNIDVKNNVLPCDVENAMRKFNKEPMKAIEMIIENKTSVLEEFTF